MIFSVYVMYLCVCVCLSKHIYIYIHTHRGRMCMQPMMSSYFQKTSKLMTGRRKLTSSTQNGFEYWGVGPSTLLPHFLHRRLFKNG